MTEPKKTIRNIVFVGLILLNIVLLTIVLQRYSSIPKPEAKSADPVAPTPGLESRLYLPLAATVLTDPIALLPGDTVYLEKDQELQIVHVLGEVYNNTPTTVNKVVVEATLNLKSGTQTTLRGSPLADSIPAGGRACFDLYAVEAGEVSSYSVKVLSYATGGALVNGVEALVANAGYSTEDSWYSVNGVISGAEPAALSDLRAVVTLFDGSGRVLGCEQTYVRTETEEANAPAAFSVIFMSRDFSAAASYLLAISGSAQ